MTGVRTECERIADQLRQAFGGHPWHGSPVRDLLAGVTAGQAQARPLAGGHTIWELVLHMDAWIGAAIEAAEGKPMAQLMGTPQDWPAVTATGEADWAAATGRLFEHAEALAVAIAGFEDARLVERVPPRRYDFYFLFHGIVQHSLYHGGQIGMLKRAAVG
jgi:hypothetical protein